MLHVLPGIKGLVLMMTLWMIPGPNRTHAQAKPLLPQDASRVQSAELSDADITIAIGDLASKEFRVRQEAFQRLAGGGTNCIEHLEEGAKSDDPETAERCFEALVQISSNKDSIESVTAAMERLATGPSSKITSLAKDHVKNLKMTDEDRAVEGLTAEGVRIHRGRDGEVFSVTITQDKQFRWLKYLPRLHSLRLSGVGVTDDGIDKIPSLERLSSITIMRTSLTGIGLSGLRKLPKLESVSLSGDEFSGEDLGVLREIPTLERIALISSVDKDALRALTEVRQIDRLYLSGLDPDQEGLTLINQLGHLKRLHMSVRNADNEDLRLLGQLRVPTELDLMPAESITDEGWKQLPNARLIGLNALGTQATDSTLAEIGKISMLEDLAIAGTSVTDSGLQHLYNLKALRTLSIIGAEASEEAVAQLRRSLPNLTIVSISGQSAARPPGVRRTISFTTDRETGEKNAHVSVQLTAALARELREASDLKTVFLTSGGARDEDLKLLGDASLKGLVIDSVNVTDHGIQILEDHPTLESLGLWSSSITDRALTSIPRIQRLKKLDIKRAAMTDDGTSRLINALSKKNQIESLNLFQCAQVSDKGLTQIGHLTSLQACFLNNNGRLTSRIFREISNLKHLKRLEADSISLDESDLVFLETLTALETLGLSYGDGKSNLTDNGLANISRLPSLKSLIIGHASITDSGLSQLESLSGLEVLGLSGTDVGDEGVEKVAAMFPNLQRLYLSETKVSDVGMIHVGKLKKLEWLMLDRTAVGDAGLRHLDELGELKFIFLNNDNVSSDGHQQFRKTHPSTQILLE